MGISKRTAQSLKYDSWELELWDTKPPPWQCIIRFSQSSGNNPLLRFSAN